MGASCLPITWFYFTLHKSKHKVLVTATIVIVEMYCKISKYGKIGVQALWSDWRTDCHSLLQICQLIHELGVGHEPPHACMLTRQDSDKGVRLLKVGSRPIPFGPYYSISLI